MIGIFKQKNPINLLVLLLFGVLIKLPMFLNPIIPESHPGDGFLYSSILEFLHPYGEKFQLFYPILTFSLIFIQSVALTRIMNSKRMMNSSNYLTGMSYMLITSLLPEWNYFSAPLISNTAFIYLLSGLFKSYNLQQVKGIIYNAGLAMGAAIFLFPPAISLLIWLVMAMMVMRTFRLNEWLICLLGILTPFYFYGVYLFLSDQWDWLKLVPQFSFGFPAIKQSAWIAGSTFLLTVPFLSGAYFVQNNLRKMLIQVRKGWSLLLLFLLVSFLVPFISQDPDFDNWVLAAVPLAAFHACSYQYFTLRIFPNLLFWLSVIFILIYQYSGPGW